MDERRTKTNFFECCRDGKLEEMKKACEQQGDVLKEFLCQEGIFTLWEDSWTGTPLHAAAAAGHDACVGQLLAAGASLDDANANATSKWNKGWTALQLAAAGGHDACVGQLLAAGASVHAANTRGRTALHEAADGGHDACVGQLLAAGASVNVADTDGYTALHLAAREGHDACVGQLLAAGASVDAADSDGRTALHWAFKRWDDGGFLVVYEQALLSDNCDFLQEHWAECAQKINGRKVMPKLSMRMLLSILLTDCEFNIPQLSDVLFSMESRTVMDKLRDAVQQMDHPILLLCSLQAAFHRRATFRPMVANDMEDMCAKVEQLIHAALDVPAMDDPAVFLAAWDCKSSVELVTHPVVIKIMDNKIISLLAMPQIQHHFENTFYKMRDIKDQSTWLAKDWRALPVGFILSEFLFYCLYLALTLTVVWSGSAELSFQLGCATHLVLLLMTVGYLFVELVQLHAKGLNYYTKEAWNFLDLVFQATFFGWACTSKVQILSINLFVLPFRIMHYLSFFKRIGAFVTVLMRMIFDTLLFLVSFSIILIGYSMMCSSMLYDVDGFDSLQTSMLTLFAASLGDFDFDVFWNEETMSYEWGGVVLLSIFLLLAMVMALNMLIAILSDTYARLSEHTHEEWCLVFGGMVLESLVTEEWPENMKLPAPLTIISQLFIWLHNWTQSRWPAYVTIAVVFIIDAVVHFAVGLPFVLVMLCSEAWRSTKELPYYLGYVAFPFIWLFGCVFYFILIFLSSFHEVQDSFAKIQARSVTTSKRRKGWKYCLMSDGAGKHQYGAVEQKEDAEAAVTNPSEKPAWRSEMHAALRECPLTEDENASGQVVGLMAQMNLKVDGLRDQINLKVDGLRDQMDLMAKQLEVLLPPASASPTAK